MPTVLLRQRKLNAASDNWNMTFSNMLLIIAAPSSLVLTSTSFAVFQSCMLMYVDCISTTLIFIVTFCLCYWPNVGKTLDL